MRYSRSRRSAGRLLAAVAGACLAPALAVPAQAMQPVPFPDPPVGLQAPVPMGSTMDEPAGYQGQLSCSAAPLPGLVRLAELVSATYERGSAVASVRSCAEGGTSEHKEGRALDWMLDVNDKGDRRVAGDFLGWLTADDGAMAHRLGVMYVIYAEQIWSAYSPAWRDYSGYSPHTDHIHISLSWNGARGHTSFWTGRTWKHDYGSCQVFAGQPGTAAGRKPRTQPCPAPATSVWSSQRPLLWLGSGGTAVSEVQRSLGVSATGTFGTVTRSAVLDYQRSNDLPRTGAVDDPTWSSLGAGTLEAPAWSPTEAAEQGRAMGSPELGRKDAGWGVYALQTALRLPIDLRTGYVGKHTAAAVVAAKSAFGLDGNNPRVTAELWERLPR